MSAFIAGDCCIPSVPAPPGNKVEHLSGRIRKKIVGFERTIAGFRQRRLS
ncbi:hypothetical protein [Methanoregula sp.]